MRTLALCIALALLGVPVLSAEQFKDVPKDHWAADSVTMLAKAGIVQGYPDSTYKGDKPVTRYELAVALANFVQFMEQSRKPILKETPKASSDPKLTPGDKAMAFLKDDGFLPADSKLLTDGSKPVTFSELAQALSSVGAKLIERSVPPTKPEESDTPSPGK